MKFALIFLISFCAFAAQAQNIPSHVDLEPEFRGPVIDGVKDMIKKAVEFINESIARIVEKIKEIIEKVKEATGGVIGDALQKAWAIVKKIADIAKTGIVAQVCVKPHEQRIAELMEQMQAGQNVCTGKSQEELEKVANTVMEIVATIQGYVKELYDMVAECFNDDSILGGTWCVAKQVFDIRDKVKAAVDMAEQAITETKEKALEIVEIHQQCVAAATEIPMKELHNIMGDVQQCIAENQ